MQRTDTPRRDLLVGVDVGGTKTDLRVLDRSSGRVVLDTSAPSDGWAADPVEHAAHWLERLINRHLEQAGRNFAAVAVVAVGAQGCNDVEHCLRLQDALTSVIGAPSTVTNDAALLVPATGVRSGVGVVAGTGAIAVGHHRSTGQLMFAGGWGWVLGDEGSAPALVRDAVRAALRLSDRGESDLLLHALLECYGVPDAPRLARAVNDTPTVENWVRGTVAVFDAADGGSELAASVIRDAGHALADCVMTLANRGAAVENAVAAGSVITHQPRLFDAFSQDVQRRLPATTVHLLTQPPVAGALALAASTWPAAARP